MLDVLLLLGIPALIGVVYLGWRYGFDRNARDGSTPAARRREDARDWQRRFASDSPWLADFFPPTQNEILETLYVLDHLLPAWETGDTAQVERAFLNELSINFPTLRKPQSAFPLGLDHDGAGPEVHTRREAFRARRAQANALDQIVSQAPAGVEPDAPLDYPSLRATTWSAGRFWPTLLAGAALVVALALVGVKYFPRPAHPNVTPAPGGDRVAASDTASLNAASPEHPALDATAPETSPAPLAPAPGDPPAAPPVSVAPVVNTEPPPPSPSAPSAGAEDLNRQIAASKQRAVERYPALAVEGSEINLRFVFRYKNLVQQNSPRLLEPNWPEQLVEECAAAAGVSSKRDHLTQVLGSPR